MENEANSGFWSIGSKADENDVWTAEKTAAEWAEELKGYDYVLLFRATDSFASEFGGLFGGSTEVESSRVFQVDNSGSTPSLKIVP
jgi:hypothetical protein